MSRPGAIALSRESFSFLRANLGTFAAHLKYALPLVILLAVVRQGMRFYGYDHLLLVLMVPSFFIYGCFILSWHRVSLRGPENINPVNPFMMTKDDFKFILTFAGLSGTLYFILAGMNYAADKVLPGQGTGIILAAQIAMLATTLFAMYWFLRLSFIFPAQAQGVSLTMGDVLRASRGMVLSLIGANFMMGLLFVVAFSVYGLVAGMIATVSGGDAELSRVGAASIGLVLSVPVHVAIFFVIAFGVTALSRAYQWGMENNAH